MADPRVVKRYNNRKLYDTARSCYVTLDDIALMIRAGEDVQVVDNTTGEDLTKITLTQIIFEAEKKNSFMPLSLLRGLIQDSGNLAREHVDKVQAKAQDLRNSAQKLRTDFEERIDKGIKEATRPAQAARRKLVDLVGASQRVIEEMQVAVEDVQRNVDRRIKGGVEAVSKYATLGQNVDELRQRLEHFKSHLEKISISGPRDGAA